MSDNSNAIALYRERSATDVINAAFRFLRAQSKPLLKGLLLLAAPALVLANIAALFAAGPQPVVSGGARFGLLAVQFICAIAGSVIALAIAIGAVQTSHAEGSSALTTERLWRVARTHGPSLFGRQIHAGILIGMGALFFGGIIAGIGALFASVTGVTISGIAAAGGMLGGFGWVLYAGPTFMLLLPGEVDTERPISTMRCVRLVKGRWGQTFGVWLLASLITLVLFSVGWIPRIIVSVLKATGSNPSGTVGLVLAGGVSGIANALAPAVTYTAITFQYYNLIEQKEQVSLEKEVGRMEQETEASTEDPTSGPAQPDMEPDAGGEAGVESAPLESEPSSSETASDDDQRWQGDGSSK